MCYPSSVIYEQSGLSYIPTKEPGCCYTSWQEQARGVAVGLSETYTHMGCGETVEWITCRQSLCCGLTIRTGYWQSRAQLQGWACFTCHGELHMLSRSVSHCGPVIHISITCVSQLSSHCHWFQQVSWSWCGLYGYQPVGCHGDSAVSCTSALIDLCADSIM